LQEHTFERLGSNQTRRMEARVICATHRNLWELVKSAAFRADLYYRLNTVEIQLPPLRERRDDIIPLALSFLRSYAAKHSRPVRRLAPLTMSILQEYDWPGNVRELQNVIERAVVVSDDAEVRCEHLPVQFSVSLVDEVDPAASFDGEVRNFKRRLIQRTLIENGNNKLQAARSLKIARSSLHRLIDELDVNLPNEFLN
jgi:DNA-binding NtrC family response regulator